MILEWLSERIGAPPAPEVQPKRDRRRGRKSVRKFKIAADYLAWKPLKNIEADHGCCMQTIAKARKEFDLPLRQPEKAKRIRASMASLAKLEAERR